MLLKILPLAVLCSFVSGSFSMGGKLQASCGDYLMLLGQHGQPDTPSSPNSGHFASDQNIAAELISVRSQLPICRGKGCGQAPKSSDSGAGAVIVSRVVVGVGILVVCQSHERPVTAVRYVHVTSNLVAQQVALEHFRPPRICA
jgi:hypothetical protein